MLLPAFPVNVERARAFVLAHGGSREQARVEGIFGRTEPERAVVKELEKGQLLDGSFPAEGASQGDAATTCAMLSLFKEIPPLSGAPMASRALAFLRRTQETNGAWQGDTELTAAAAYALLTMEPEHQDPLVRASRWLRQALGQVGAGEQASNLALIHAAALWGRVLGPGATETAWAYDLLARRELRAGESARWLTTVVETGLEARFFPVILQQLQNLAASQGADGSWEGAVATTLTALRAFRGFRLI